MRFRFLSFSTKKATLQSKNPCRVLVKTIRDCPTFFHSVIWLSLRNKNMPFPCDLFVWKQQQQANKQTTKQQKQLTQQS